MHTYPNPTRRKNRSEEGFEHITAPKESTAREIPLFMETEC
jgi:hypothetical protein